MHSTILTSLVAAVTVVSGTAVHSRQSQGILAEIKGWKNVTDCSSSTNTDFDFNLGNSTLGACVPLPFTVATIELGALRVGPYQASFYANTECIDGVTADVPGVCMISAHGSPWLAVKVAAP